MVVGDDPVAYNLSLSQNGYGYPGVSEKSSSLFWDRFLPVLLASRITKIIKIT
jgi:hypothetical protein